MSRRQLRPYQVEDREKILRVLRQRRHPLYVLPTGGGKTTTFVEVAEIVSGAGWPTLILTHRWELLSQASRTLHRLRLPHGLIYPGRMLAQEDVYVASIDTLASRLDNYAPFLTKIRLVIVDEAHHAVCGKYMRVFDALDRALRLGVTATPFRADGTGLGLVFDTAVEGPSMSWLTEQAYLVPVDIYAPPLHLDLRSVRISCGDYSTSELERILNNPDVTEPAVQQYARLASGRPAIFFCVSRAHCVHVAEQLTKAGYAAAPVDGKMPEEVRNARLRGLADGTLQALTSCELVSEGTDVPNVEVGVMLRPTKSTGLFQQQGGRFTRPSVGKARGILIDMVGNTLEHGMLDEERAWSLDGGREHRDVTPVHRCRSCFRVARVDDRRQHCQECGEALPARKLAALSVPGDGKVNRRRVIASMSDDQLKTGGYRTLMRLASSVDDLERIARAKNYHCGWVRHQAKEKGLAA